MKSMVISAFALLAAFTQAAPAPIQNLAPREIVEITFEGATPSAYFIEGFPTNGEVVAICKFSLHTFYSLFMTPSNFTIFLTSNSFNPPSFFRLINTQSHMFKTWTVTLMRSIANVLSISHISSPGGASCTFYGIDGSVTKVTGTELVDVGPPQTQISGSCWAI
jgi:hypothetical protein